MNFLYKLERKFGKHAISILSLYLILCYGCGYLMRLINPAFLNYLTLDPYQILHGQVWRIVTWILVPPGTLDFFTLIMLYFYYSIGTSLERTWGKFLYNVYMFFGMMFTVLGSFVAMGISYIFAGELMSYGGIPVVICSEDYFRLVSMHFSTYYINMSIFLAFAATFPNVQVLLMFIIPIKVKWLGMAVTFVMVIATAVTYLLQMYVLVPLGVTFLQTIVFILVIAALVQVLEIVMKKAMPVLYQALGVFLPLITTNCAVLGVAILVIQKNMTLIEALVYSVSTAIGFTLALVIFAGIREQLNITRVPKSMQGIPIALITAGILAMAFMGFAGIKIG